MEATSNAEIRAWARANGHVVADRGRIPVAVLGSYRAAHAGPIDIPNPAMGPVDVPAEARPEVDAPRAVWPAPEAPDPARSSGAWGAPPSSEPPPAPWPAPPPWDPAQRPWQPGPASVPPPARPAEGNDGVANAALWLGLIPFLGGILGIGLGVLALRRLRTSHRPGRSAAQAGIAVGACWLLIFGAVALALSREADRDPSGTVVSRGTVTASDLRTGDCPSSLPDGQFKTMELVPCKRPHLAEVYGTFGLTGSGFPGTDQVRRFANGGCIERLTPFVGPGREAGFRLYYTMPTDQSWAQGDRQVRCVITTRNGSLLPGGTAKVA